MATLPAALERFKAAHTALEDNLAALAADNAAPANDDDAAASAAADAARSAQLDSAARAAIALKACGRRPQAIARARARALTLARFRSRPRCAFTSLVTMIPHRLRRPLPSPQNCVEIASCPPAEMRRNCVVPPSPPRIA